MQAMSLNFALAQKEKQALQPVKIKAKACAIDMGIIFHTNDTFKRLIEVVNTS